jgi:uncharacterized repeat protein (TIGR03943 family)
VHTDKCGHDHAHEHGSHCCHNNEAHEDAEWTRRFFLLMQAVVLVMIGGVMCYFVASGRIGAYLVGNFKILALAGGIGIIILGLFNLMMRDKNAGCGHDHSHGEEEETSTAASPHTHDGSVASRAVTLLLLSGSIAAAAILTPDHYSRDYLMNKGSAIKQQPLTAEQLKQKNPGLATALSQASQTQGGLTLERLEKNGLRKNKDGNYELSVMDLHYMPSDLEYARVMDGQNVAATGQLVKDTANPGPGHMRLFTLQITCCAADAQPYSVPVVFEGGDPKFVDAGWYVISGKVEIGEERGMRTCRIKAKDLTATLRPPEQRMGF